MISSKQTILVITIVQALLLSACTNITQEDNGVVENCDTIIDKEYYEICYDYSYKGALFVSYSLDGNDVNRVNLEDRPTFYSEPSLDEKYSSNYSDYIGSGYDRGHLASDASFDYSYKSLDSVYSMANIIPQNPDVNQKAWIDTEYLERKKAVEYGDVEVTIGVVYSDYPERIGESLVAVPMGYYKSILNSGNEYQECFYYENLPLDDDDTIENHKVECSALTLKYQ